MLGPGHIREILEILSNIVCTFPAGFVNNHNEFIFLVIYIWCVFGTIVRFEIQSVN